MVQNYPIADLIEYRLSQLGIRRSELARRCGFNNIAKGIRRIGQVCNGQLDDLSAEKVLAALPKALEIDEEVVRSAIHKTIEIIREADRSAVAEAEAAWRASFVPHGYLLGSKTRPSNLTIYGITGGSRRWLRIQIDSSKPPITFTPQALAVVRRTPIITFFGKTTGFIINYSPDSAVRFDLKGNPVGHLTHAYKPAEVQVWIGKRRLPEGWGFA